MKIKYKEDQLSPERFALIDKETGVIEEFKNGIMVKKIKTDMVTFDSKSYLYLDTDRLKMLHSIGITETDLGLLMLISYNLSFIFNVCLQDDSKPHKTSSIRQLIKQSHQATKRKLNRLVELGVLAYEKIPLQEHNGKVYIVNPYLIRRGKDFSDYIPTIFHDFIDKS
jgi:predicted transcriptional regulator